jgi:isoleucyl-tRNA synthetase
MPISPAFGALDLRIALDNDLPLIIPLQLDGFFIPEVRAWQGKNFKDVDLFILEDLNLRGLLFRSETIVQPVSHCFYCNSPLLNIIHSTWFLRISNQSEHFTRLTDGINWTPEEARLLFTHQLEGKTDWPLGRERYFGTPLPIWVDEDGDMVMVGSFKELAELSGVDLELIDPHRPGIDGITIPNPKTGEIMHRVPELVDAWFDAGAMPFSQWHYPFEEQTHTERRFSADLVCEPANQIHGWLYFLHVVNGMLLESEAFRNAVCLGRVLESNSNLSSKGIGNVLNAKEVLQECGSDVLRWFFLINGAGGQDVTYNAEQVAELSQGFIQSLWKSYSFFVTYARAKGWSPAQIRPLSLFQNVLDRWLRSLLHSLIRSVSDAYACDNIPGVIHPLMTFVESLSAWYISLSHHRFWMSRSAIDEQEAFAVLHEVLTTLSHLIAPLLPFIAEDMYQNLVCNVDPAAPESVHLAQFPQWDETAIDEELNRDMLLVVHLTNLGKAAREKVRSREYQPAQAIIFTVANEAEVKAVNTYADILTEMLRVNRVSAQVAEGEPYELVEGQYSLFTSIESIYQARLVTDDSLKTARDGLAQAFIQYIVEMRRQAGYDLTDPIRICYKTDDRLTQAIESCRTMVMRGTIALELKAESPDEGMFIIHETLGGEELTIGIQRI